MFQALIRRKLDQWSVRPEEIALESTTFSLSTEVPRPTDQRTEERLLAILPVAKLVTDGYQDFCRIKYISAGGLMGADPVGLIPSSTVQVRFEGGILVPAEVKWTEGSLTGLAFSSPVLLDLSRPD